MTKLIRCDWCLSDPLYIDYHDNEWGVPQRDSQKLFEFLLLEGMQAGLSWITILKRRCGIKAAFFDFDMNKLASLSDTQIDDLLQDKRIIRNRLKVLAARKNAQASLNLLNKCDFSEFLWQFTDGYPVNNQWAKLSFIPNETEQSKAMSRALKQAGFSFVGPTICYAFMQAVGMVNDHVVDCFRHQQLATRREE